jgi:hypothetical protein
VSRGDCKFGELDLETPRDRKATFDPKIVAKANEVNRVRRQDHLHVRAWYDDAGDPCTWRGCTTSKSRRR